ncbi:3-hydroxyisobutyrate dehydrogenase [Thermogymnomonas acidicola]|uniref:3-hydroxyisobutyrate dehydrogenase n=1 Tax=Thermogymnomonas acidicola TaxID=399579 RepID=A0AA37BPX3_9ARCH|nr:NAD(P)-dependent oxidoreductase [Thermogymnomonas acidicola]GGM68156.1 3-hydroxyisobutyrate dehydrogenase [Thermogymnomonas acidicola]
MPRMGFIGLGKMGIHIASRINTKFHLTGVYNRTPEKAIAIDGEAVRVFRTPYDLAYYCDTIFVMVSDSQVSARVFDGPEGILGNLRQGQTVVNMSTVSLEETLRESEACASRGARYIDAPVIGSVPQAREGTLTMVAGGDQKAFEEVREVCSTFCSRIFYLGQVGNGIKAKLVNNSVMAINMAAVCEALALAERLGLSRSEMLDILSSGGADSRVLQMKRPYLLGEATEPQFLLSHMLKDSRYAMDLAASVNWPMPVTSVSSQMYASAASIGLGNLDFSSVLRAFRMLGGKM